MDPFSTFLFTQVASPAGFVILVLIVAGLFFFRGRVGSAIAILLSAGGLMVMVELLKGLFRTPRPPDPLITVSGYAMPSGHAAGAAFLALLCTVLTYRSSTPYRHLISALSLTFALLVGLSRAVLHVHTIDQVVVGFALGSLFVLLYVYLERSLDRH